MLTAPPGLTQDAVDRAALLVALHIGLDSLSAETHQDTGVWEGKPHISLSRPASLLANVTLGTTDVTDWARLQTSHAVRLYPSSVNGFGISRWPYATTYEVTYRSGWHDAQSLPAAIKQAILLTAEASGALGGASVPDGVASIRLPEISVTFSGTGHQSGALPATAQQLLKPWRKLTW